MPRIVVKTELLNHTGSQVNRLGQSIAMEKLALRVVQIRTLSGVGHKSGVSQDIQRCLREMDRLAIRCDRIAASANKAADILNACERRLLLKVAALVAKEFAQQEKPKVELPQIETKEDYYDMIDVRANNAIDAESKELYDKYRKKVRMGSETLESGAYYHPIWNKVYLNWKEDAVDDCGPGSTYFHEVGHMIDDYTKFFGDSSSARDFTVSLQSDFDNYVNSVMSQNGLTRKEAYKYISDWLWIDPDVKGGLSDLMGGLSKNECVGRWLHDTDYWRGKQHGVPEKVNNEAFAHFFEASMSTDSAKLDYLKEVFPTAYAEYKKIVRNNL